MSIPPGDFFRVYTRYMKEAGLDLEYQTFHGRPRYKDEAIEVEFKVIEREPLALPEGEKDEEGTQDTGRAVSH